MIDALIVLTSSYDANFESTPEALNVRESLWFLFVSIPIDSNRVIIVLTSARSGMPLRTISQSDKIDAVIIGNAAFLAPDILTLPLRGYPPLITNFFNGLF